MGDGGPTPLDQLITYEKIGKIKVRICRIWRPKFSGMTDKYGGLHCVLVDEKEQAIEASSEEMDYDIIVSKTEAGACYEIMNFRTNKMRGQYRVVPHDTHVVLTAKTAFNKLTSGFSQSPIDLMEDIEMTPIFELWPYIKAEKIKARVCRIWQ